MRGPHWLKTVLASLLACGLALLLAACAGSPRPGVASLSNDKTGSSSNASKIASDLAPGLEFSSCMRSHGVTHFPDRTVSGGQNRLNITDNAGASASVFQAAQKACWKFFPAGVSRSAPSAATVRQALAVAACMRSHGVPDFPDPTTSPPGAPPTLPSGHVKGEVYKNSEGETWAFPGLLGLRSPLFEQAATTCGFSYPA